MADLNVYTSACGYEAVQGLIGGYFGIWDFKETKGQSPICCHVPGSDEKLSQKQDKTYAYNDWIGWLPSHLLIVAQAMQKAGSVMMPTP